MNVQIPVLNSGWVELQDMMGDDLAVVSAARTSFLGESKGEEQDKKLLFYLMKHQHLGPFEQVQFRFRIKAPLLVWWQMVRHRTFSFNLQSGRYVEFNADDFYLPDHFRKQSINNKQGSSGYVSPQLTEILYDELLEHYENSYQLYVNAIKDGVAKEQARLFLPAFGLYYVGVVRTDARNLMHFFDLRLDEHAQWEIRRYAGVMYQIFEEKLPWTAEAYRLKWTTFGD